MRTLYRISILTAACLTGYLSSIAQEAPDMIARLTQTPLHYVVHRTDTPPRIDGMLSDPVWQSAAWTDYFSDIEGDIRPKPLYHTRVKMLWDENYLYIGAELEEPQVWATVAHHDEVVFRDNDFEVFINPENNAKHYFEIETNAIGTIFDLYLPEPYRNGGGALISWNVDGMRKAIRIIGSLNKPDNTDIGWTVELAIPIASISMGNGPQTPAPGSLWRINFSRVEWDTDIIGGHYVKRTDSTTHRPLPEHNWVWSPQGVVNMHFPERWGYLSFAGPSPAKTASQSVQDSSNTFVLPLSEQLKNCLWEVYYRENMYSDEHKSFTGDPTQLAMQTAQAIGDKHAQLTIEATTHTYIALLTCTETGETWSIDPQGNIGRRK